MNIRSLTHANWIEALSNRNVCPYDLIESLLEEGYKFMWHPLGFAMCRVARRGKASIRVHVWPSHNRYQQTPAWLIHDHLFHLKSWVLAGEIKNQEYMIKPNGKDHVIYEARYEGDCSTLNKTETYCSKFLTEKTVYSKGSVYEVAAGVFHESQSISNKTTVTVCETFDEVDMHPRILGSVDGLPSYSYQRKCTTKDEICELAKNI